MKYTTALIGFVILATGCLAQQKKQDTASSKEKEAQNTEFGKSSNGLIYSDTTISKLKFIVNKPNLKFKVCDNNPSYLSKPQARAHYFSIDSGRVKEAIKYMDAGVPFSDLAAKYPEAETDTDLLVVRFAYKNYDEKNVVEYSSIVMGRDYSPEISFDTNTENYSKDLKVKGKWLFDHRPKSEYSGESVSGFYFFEELEQRQLPDMYARMIQYSDCMVDTTARIFYDNEHTTSRNQLRGKQPDKLKKFIDYVHKATRMPAYSDKKKDNYWAKYHVWDSLRIFRVDSLKKTDKQFNALLTDAVNDALANGGSTSEFEEYVGLYHSKSTELELKRGRRVVGGCSRDQAPRYHAVDIAKLAAETINWEIFLRAHLDIMNDRFERVSDGSYAWAGRKTYIKELEVLDINVLELLLGISMRVENTNENHYYGSIGRLGRALAETGDPAPLEATMLQMIADNNLDLYNRILIYYLFNNYNHYQENKEKQAGNQEKLATAVKTFPSFITAKMKTDE